MTYTFAELEVTERTYREIHDKLEAAGYQHAFTSSGAIDMQGIGLVPGPAPRPRLERVRIDKPEKLDPITVYLEDFGNGQGRAVIVCFNDAWNCFWGSMGGGCTVREFIPTCDAHYLAGCMVSGRSKVAAYERGYVVRVAQAVIAFFAEGADARA